MMATNRRLTHLTLVAALLLDLCGALPAPAASGASGGKPFASPEQAVAALAAAVRKGDRKEIVAVMGPGSEEIVSSGDPVADREGRERFLRLYQEKKAVVKAAPDKALLSVGAGQYPFPVPVIKKGDRWFFDARAGKEELLNRRIGRNELEVMDVLHAYVAAQREYASKERGSGLVEFAQKIRSTPGKRDGLYWQAKEGEEESPLGPLAAQAAREGYSASKSGKPTPFHGYIFRILKAQGKSADGGAYDYVVNGRMVLGFAMVAYPARYGSSGVMTFIVNQNDTVYQKDLGKESGKVAAEMKAFNPDPGWKKVDDSPLGEGDSSAHH